MNFRNVTMYSFTELNNSTNLKFLYEKVTGNELKRHSNQWEGSCPFCGGTDRFYISDAISHKWFCRNCRQSGGTAIDFVSRYYNLPSTGTGLKETAERLAVLVGITEADARYTKPTQHKEKEPELVSVLPDVPTQEWQSEVKTAVLKARDYLFTPSARRQMEYLKSRGFTEKTLEQYYIGYNPIQYGLNVMVDEKPVQFWQGYIIPCFAQIFSTDNAMDIVRVKVRIDDGKFKHLTNLNERFPDKYRKPQKYWFIKGSKAKSLFCAKYALKYPNIIYVEGEFDVMTINQTAGDICKAVTFGSHDYIGDAEQWQAWYRAPENTVICFDNDSDAKTADAVKQSERKLNWEIIKAQSLDSAEIRGNSPVIRHLPESFHDWNEVLQLHDGSEIIRDTLSEWFLL